MTTSDYAPRACATCGKPIPRRKLYPAEYARRTCCSRACAAARGRAALAAEAPALRAHVASMLGKVPFRARFGSVLDAQAFKSAAAYASAVLARDGGTVACRRAVRRLEEALR